MHAHYLKISVNIVKVKSKSKVKCPIQYPGMNILLDGTVPKSAGLSSSSALVCCAALTTAYANNKSFTKVRFRSLIGNKCCQTEFNTTFKLLEYSSLIY